VIEHGVDDGDFRRPRRREAEVFRRRSLLPHEGPRRDTHVAEQSGEEGLGPSLNTRRGRSGRGWA
jgi:hypothetical protein